MNVTSSSLWISSARVLRAQGPHLHLSRHWHRASLFFIVSAVFVRFNKCVRAVPLATCNIGSFVSRVMAATSCQAWSAVSITHTAERSSTQRSASPFSAITIPCLGTSTTSRESLPATTVVMRVRSYNVFRASITVLFGVKHSGVMGPAVTVNFVFVKSESVGEHIR